MTKKYTIENSGLVDRVYLDMECVAEPVSTSLCQEMVEKANSFDELKKAFCDVLDGNYQPYEIQAQTGMTMERCEEISNLFKRLVQN